MNNSSDQTASDGRDPETGRFAPGNSGGRGRTKGVDFRAAIEQHAKENDVDLETAIWEVFKAMLEKAKGGDVNAAKLVLDRLCGPVREEHYIETNHPYGAGPEIPTGDAWREWIKKFVEMQEEIDGPGFPRHNGTKNESHDPHERI